MLTSIAIDVEHRWVGKVLGAQRAIQLVEAVMPVQEVRYSVGDSPSDYDMADWLHDSEHNVTHLDVEHEPRTQDVAYTVIRENPANSQGLAEDDITGAIILWTVFAVLVVLFAGAWLLGKLASYCGNAVN